VLGALEIDHESLLKSLPQPSFEAGELRRVVLAREDRLRAGVNHRVECMEELLGCSRLSVQELDVVEQQDVAVTVQSFERLEVAAPEGARELGREALDGRIMHREPLAMGGRVVCDCLHQVGLPGSRRSADEQGVVSLAG
jgi:hypothetical protein